MAQHGKKRSERDDGQRDHTKPRHPKPKTVPPAEDATIPMGRMDDNADKNTLFLNLIQALHTVVDFEEAFILQMQDDQRMLVTDSTLEKLRGTSWEPNAVFKKVLSGKPVAASDISLIKEWADQSESLRKDIASALHINLGGGRLSILVLTHSRLGYFGPPHVGRLQTFAPLASQALLSLDLRKAVIQRDRFFQLSMDLMGIVDYSGNFMQLNSSWRTILGHRFDDFFKTSLLTFIHDADVQIFRDAIGRLQKTGEQCLVEGRFRRYDGSYCWLSCSLAAYHDERLCYIVARDVSDRVMIERQLAYDARHDALTGLYNRVEFMERLDIAFARSLREPWYAFAIFYMDLNGFKAVNDTLGHSVGDALLKEVSQCLLDVVREVDTVARFGGDEFTVLLDAVKSRKQIAMVIQRIHGKLLFPFFLQGHEVKTSVSIGVALSSPSYPDAEHMLRDADVAMYRAKMINVPYVLIEKNDVISRFEKRRKKKG